MRLLLCILLISAINYSYSQNLTREQAEEDIHAFFNQVAAYHPDMYWHTPKSVVDSFISQIKIMIAGDSVPPGVVAYWLSHANHFFDNHTGFERHNATIKTDKVFPEVDYKGNKVFFKGTSLKINTINNISADGLMDWQKKLYGCDESQRYMEYMLSMPGEFQRSVNESLLYSPYKIMATDSLGKDSLITCFGEDNTKLEEKRKVAFIFEKNKPYGFEIYPKEKIAIIRYDEVFWNEDYPEIGRLISDFFRNCRKKKIEYLFFDISRNSGGIISQFKIFFPYLPLDKNKCYILYSVGKNGKEYEEVINAHDQELKKSHKVPFKGAMFIYQSYFSKSAAPIFAAAMKVLGNAKLVGKETGSIFPVYSCSRSFYLPHSGYEYTVSEKLYRSEFPKLSRTSEGFLLPDIEYPFLTERRLNVEDCKKIIELNNDL